MRATPSTRLTILVRRTLPRRFMPCPWAICMASMRRWCPAVWCLGCDPSDQMQVVVPQPRRQLQRLGCQLFLTTIIEAAAALAGGDDEAVRHCADARAVRQWRIQAHGTA